jgi:hypothetical protein
VRQMSSAEQGAAATEPLSSVHTVTERDLAACMACRPSLDPAAARRRARARYGWALGIAIMTPLVAVGVRLAPAIVAGIVLASVWIAFYPRAARIADTRAAQRAIAAGAGAEMLG